MAVSEEKIEDFATRKRSHLFERISLFATVMGTIHFVLDLIGGSKEAPVIDMMITIVLFTCYVLHRKGYRNTSRILALSFLNVCLAVYACLLVPEVGVYLFFFPLMAVSTAIFEPKEKAMRISFVLLPAFCAILLFLTDFNFGSSYLFNS